MIFITDTFLCQDLTKFHALLLIINQHNKRAEEQEVSLEWET